MRVLMSTIFMSQLNIDVLNVELKVLYNFIIEISHSSSHLHIKNYINKIQY